MSKPTHVVVSGTVRVRVPQMATIPMPAPVYRLVTTVRYGDSGPTYLVETGEVGENAVVYSAHIHRRRPMRRCGRRDAILAAVARALPHTRPVHTRAS